MMLIHNQIFGQKSNDKFELMENLPYQLLPISPSSGSVHIEVIGAHTYLGRHYGINCSEKCQAILIQVRVICQYLIGVNWKVVHCCACPGIILYCAEKLIMQES